MIYFPHLSVAVTTKTCHHRYIFVTGKRKNTLSEEDVHILDWAEIKNVDLTIRHIIGSKQERVE